MKLKVPQIHTLPSGLRLVHTQQRSSGAGIFGIAVRAGSADERANEQGLAHFVEHTIFKGTQKRSSWHIINRMEAVGGELNAYTTKEETVVYSIFPSGNASRAIELIADLALNSRFPEKELAKEREVVIDEIYSYRDTPSEAIYDDFEELALAGTPLAHNILGSPESVRNLGTVDCRGFLERNYRSGNIVAFYSGPQSLNQIASYVERYFADLHQGVKESVIANYTIDVPHFEHTETLDIHQAHAIVGAHVDGLFSPRRHAVSLFSNIIGGPGMNSLLNVELRERRGLVYTVEASTAMFSTGGLLTVYFGCDTEDIDRCLDLTNKVFSDIANGSITSQRLERAKKQYLGQLAIASENRENCIMAAARSVLFRNEAHSYRHIADEIAKISCDEIVALGAAMRDASTLLFIPQTK